MKKLKIILLFSLILFIILSYVFQNSYKMPNSNNLEGVITNYKIDGNKLSLEINNKYIANYYFKNENEFNKIKLGDYVFLKGNYKLPNKNTNFNLFNYQKYLKNKKIYYLFDIEDIKIKEQHKIFYNIKNKIIERINKSKNKEYLKLFLLGENELDQEIKNSYQNNGISHLFCISGMHITLFTSLLLSILNKLIKNKKLNIIIVSLFLLLYIFLTNYTVSVIRASLFFIVLNFKKITNIKISNIELLFLLLIILLIYNPFYIYNLGFLYSFSISISLIYFSKKSNSNYIFKLFNTSLIAFLISLPITINNNYSINLLTPFINLIFVPMVSFIIFPFSLLNFIFMELDSIYSTLLDILENISICLSNINCFNLTLSKMSLFIFALYYLIIILILKKKIRIYILIILLFIHNNINYLNKNYTISFLDVKQGDSTLLILPYNKGNILIDTGGILEYEKEKWKQRKKYGIAEYTIIPYLKSFGIKRINYLILTHGDFDHMGEAINLVNNFKVEKVIFNCGPYNDLEKELIKVLDKKKIKYYSCIKELNIDKNKLYFLQTKVYDNENDNSNVMYTELNGYKFMFMGDASTSTEKEILSKYNLSDVDVLKVGHHGSKTSSGKVFIDEINPKYSIISVGKNNHYGHPNKEVLDNLDNSKIYRTDENGNIMFKIKNNKLQVETCSP